MKKILLFLLLTITFNFFGQTILPLTSLCGAVQVDLTTKYQELLNGQNPGENQITFHLTQVDATNNINPLVNPTNFTATDGQIIFASILNNITTLNVVKSFVINIQTGIQATIVILGPNCFQDATVLINIISGTVPYIVSLFKENVLLYTTNPTSEQSFTFILPSGSYNLLIGNNNGCSFIQPFFINVPPPISIQSTVNGNTITLQASGGVPPYQYGFNGSPYQSSPVFTNLNPNTVYNFSVRDSNNCLENTTVSTSNNCNFFLNIVGTLDIPVSEYIISILSPIPSIGPFRYTLDGGTSINVPQNQSVFNIPTLGLSVGTHIVAVTDQSTQCTQNISFTILPFNRLTGSAISTYVDSNNDGFTNVGDTINYQFTINNISTADAVNVNLLPNNPALTIFGNPIANLAVNAIDTSTFTGVYVLNQNDINQGSVILNVDLVANSLVSINNIINLNKTLNITDGIKLNAFIDSNGNGSQDNNEQNFSLGSFTKQLNSDAIQNISSSNGNHYLYETNSNNIYNFNYVINASVANQYSVAPTNFNNISVANGSGITILNFPITALPYIDSSIYLFGEQPRPGFTYSNTIVYKNEGNTTITSGTLTFNKDNAVSIINVSQFGTTNTANGFTYDFTNLMPFESRTILVNMQIPVIPIVNLGQILTNTASISVTVNDVNITNNNSTLYQTIVGSYDPNDKAESHGGQILKSSFTANDYLTYRIRFENTGTASAITVKVTDILDNKLDETSIKMVNSSHNYVLNRTGRNLEWRFDGINLPPSVENTQIGHGYILFQVKPKLGFVVGDIISNIANIYFDFNPAIITNECLTEFVSVLKTNNFAFQNLVVNPNPVKDILNISNLEKIENVEITNVLGQMVFTEKTNDFQSQINLSELNNGIYFVKVSSNNKHKTVKIIKE